MQRDMKCNRITLASIVWDVLSKQITVTADMIEATEGRKRMRESGKPNLGNSNLLKTIIGKQRNDSVKVALKK